MRNRFDQLAKQIGREALSPSGATVVSAEISPETQHADLRHDPDPTKGTERAKLGLLGRLAAVLCLIEIYGHVPTTDEFRACLAKHLAFWRDRVRRARGRETHQRTSELTQTEPFLWIIAVGMSRGVLDKLKVDKEPGWPQGVYFFGADVLRVGIVVAGELARDRESLLVRLMAAGPLLKPAIEDLAALPEDAYERFVAEQILLNLQNVLGQSVDRTPIEQEFLMTMQSSWADARKLGIDEGLEKGLAKGLEKGLAKGLAKGLLTTLRFRGIAVTKEAEERIQTQDDPDVLNRWLEQALDATSLDDVFDSAI